MIPSLKDVLRWRYFLRCGVRPIGVLMVMRAWTSMMSWFLEGFRDGDILDLAYYGDRVSSTIFYGFFGVLAVAIPGPLTNLLLPLPNSGCPRCGYNLKSITSPQCPECGQLLPDEFLPQPDTTQQQDPQPQQPTTELSTKEKPDENALPRD